MESTNYPGKGPRLARNETRILQFQVRPRFFAMRTPLRILNALLNFAFACGPHQCSILQKNECSRWVPKAEGTEAPLSTPYLQAYPSENPGHGIPTTA
jgi:hypothetical protein